jgi:hypothetical protein
MLQRLDCLAAQRIEHGRSEGSFGTLPSVFCTVGLFIVFAPGYQTEISDCLLYKKRLGNDDTASCMWLLLL